MAQFQFKSWHAGGSGELKCELDSKGRKRLSPASGRLEEHLARGVASLSALCNPSCGRSNVGGRSALVTQFTDLNVNLIQKNDTLRRIFDQHKSQRDPLPWGMWWDTTTI